MGLNSNANQRKYFFKKKITKQTFNKKSNGVIIKPHVKLKGVWFSDEQNKIVLTMFLTTFFVGLIIVIILGIIL